MANTFINTVRTLPRHPNLLHSVRLSQTSLHRSALNSTRAISSSSPLIRSSCRITSINAGASCPASQCRFYSTPADKQPSTGRVVELMPINVEEILTVRSIGNLITGLWAIHTGIKKVEPDFDVKEFLRGAAQAVEVVSTRLADQKFDELTGLVVPEAIEVIKGNVALMTDMQRRDLPLRRENITMHNWIRINFSEVGPKKTAEITVRTNMISNKPNDPEDFKKFL